MSQDLPINPNVQNLVGPTRKVDLKLDRAHDSAKAVAGVIAALLPKDSPRGVAEAEGNPTAEQDRDGSVIVPDQPSIFETR